MRSCMALGALGAKRQTPNAGQQPVADMPSTPDYSAFFFFVPCSVFRVPAVPDGDEVVRSCSCGQWPVDISLSQSQKPKAKRADHLVLLKSGRPNLWLRPMGDGGYGMLWTVWRDCGSEPVPPSAQRLRLLVASSGSGARWRLAENASCQWPLAGSLWHLLRRRAFPAVRSKSACGCLAPCACAFRRAFYLCIQVQAARAGTSA
jgi:hypothetical protein